MPNLLVNLPPGFFTQPSLAPHFARLEALASVHRASCNTPGEIMEHLPWADAVLMWSWPMLTDAMLDRCPNLRLSANLDISQEGARILLERGIQVSVARRAFSPAVAEMALTLILACLRRTSSHHAAMWAATEQWVASFPDDIDPDERQLTGRRVGLVGFGGIGQRLAQLLAPFDCTIAVHDPFVPTEVTHRCGVRNVVMGELVRHAEVIVLCASSNPGTKHVLDARLIEEVAPRSVLVNVARAALVDGDALLARLKKGDLYAALDVFDAEPLPADSELRKLPNVYLSPHRAGGISASVERLLVYLADDIERHFSGQPLQHALTEAMIPGLDA